MRSPLSIATLICMSFMPLAIFAQADEPLLDSEEAVSEETFCCEKVEFPCEVKDPCEFKKWYFEVKPGYYYLTDSTMRQLYGTGGLTGRLEIGYKFWGPFMVWGDGGYFQEDGHAIGGTETTKIKLATMTLGLKAIWYPMSRLAFYVGAGPRLFMVKIDNGSPFVRGEDNEFGIGGGFDGGIWFFPIPSCPNVFLDLFADYSWKKIKIQADEVSSEDFDVNVSGITGGLGLGVRF